MPGLAALRTAALFAVLPLAAACSHGGDSSPIPGPQPGLSSVATTVGGSQAPYRAVARKAAGLRPAACTPFPYSAPALPPACTIYVGGFISPTRGESPAQQIASTATFEKQIGRNLALDLHYYQWTDSFPSIGEADDYNNKRIPLDSWHCGATDASILQGTWDSLIAKRAAAIAAYGHPIFLRWKWEMNLTRNPICSDSVNDYKIEGQLQYNPTYFQAAWEHIRAIFVANGATNVIWVFNPSSSGVPPSLYYPGDSEVDWVAFDHYDQHNANFQTTMTEALRTHGSRITRTYPYFVSTFPTKPLLVGETGATQAYQQLFLGDADAALQLNFPNVQAVMYWDSTGNRGQYQLLQFGIQQYAQFAAGAYEQGYYYH